MPCNSILVLMSIMVGLTLATVNERPVIAILAIPETNNGEENSYNAYMHAQYVKFVETVGAVAVPIYSHFTSEETEYILNHVNGALFTGGALSFEDSHGNPTSYTKTAMHIFDKVKNFNDNGVNFPLWGTCMGHQLLNYLVYGKTDIIQSAPAMDSNDPLHFEFTSANQTKLFADFPTDLLDKVQKQPLTANFHNYGIHKTTFLEKKKLTDFYHLLTTSKDKNGVSYVANLEAKHYPIFSSQYHPEITEFTYAYNTNHSAAAREFAHSLAEKFVSEARKNNHKFETYYELVSKLSQTQGVDIMGHTSGTSFYDNYYFQFKQPVLVSE